MQAYYNTVLILYNAGLTSEREVAAKAAAYTAVVMGEGREERRGEWGVEWKNERMKWKL